MQHVSKICGSKLGILVLVSSHATAKFDVLNLED